MTTCFAYIRVSTQKQCDGASLEAQKRAITEYAKANCLTIMQWFEELETAAKTSRPIFTDMVKRLHRGQAEGLIVHRVDRASRNFRNWADIGELADAGVDIHFATESLDFNSRGGRLVADIQMAVASDYCRNLSIEARKGIDQRLREGLYPRPAPVGYQNHGRGQVKTPCPLRAPLVRQLFVLYLTQQHSIRSLHKEMVSCGLTTRGGRPVSRRTVENILGNPFYAGLVRNQRTGEQFHGRHEPLITLKQFDQVQAIKSGRYRKQKLKHDHRYRRLFHCARCQGWLTPERQKQRYTYYRCHKPDCVRACAKEELIDAAIYRQLGTIEFSTEDVAYLRAQCEAWDYPAKLAEERRVLDLRIADLKAREGKLLGLLLDGTIDKAAYQAQQAMIAADLARLQTERSKVGRDQASPDDLERFFELMLSLKNLYEMAKPTVQRGLLETCFSNRSWDGKNVQLEPCAELLSMKTGCGDPFSATSRDTIRTLIAVIEDAKIVP